MSKSYTTSGKRRSSMAHANHPYHLSCGRVIFGNGWRMHQRAHGCRLLTTEQFRAALEGVTTP
jgi:hypothetical protein